MEGFEDEAEECGLFPESDWELLEVIEKVTRGSRCFGKIIVSSFSFSLAVRS